MNSTDVSRRRVLVGAWAAPVLLVAVTAPAAAASGTPVERATLSAVGRPVDSRTTRYEFTAAFFSASGESVQPEYTVSGYQPARDAWIEIVTTSSTAPQAVVDGAAITILRAVAVVDRETIHVETPVVRLPSARVVVDDVGTTYIVSPLFYRADNAGVAPTFTLSGRYSDGQWRVITVSENSTVFVGRGGGVVSRFRVAAVIDGQPVEAEADPVPR
ncbi:MAG: hypothetical protein Q7T71_16970 [Herbiconiux sp.]|nr:hypothetical protein [Herbiconiux sp.]